LKTACADRRPVDPPPIIELRIFEGQPDQEVDITWDYNANFFVFATLEHARHMASGRVPSSAHNNVPVLTGSPGAGMALLERPQKAGYFIFPDLSVRHEGKYRLNFSLYEELKNQKDMDSEAPEHHESMKTAHVSHRLEVKTVPFTVFSAKKFPGLTTSTPLSIQFAEQGCRVRIRRDVRMRRREVKAGAFDDVDEEPYYPDRQRESATPDTYHSRPTMSNSRQPSVDHHMNRPGSSASNSNIHARRPSSEQMHPQYQQGPYSASPQTTQGMYPPQYNFPQGQQDAHHQYAPPQPQHGYPPHQYQPPPQSQPMAPPSHGYAPHYQQDPYHSRQNSLEYPPVAPPHGSPRAVPSPHAPQQQMQPYPSYGAPAYNGSPGYGQPSQQQSSPIQPMPHTMAAPTHPPPPSYAGHRQDSIHQASTSAQPQEHAYYRQPAPANGVKRDYGSSFDTQPLNQPLRDGARPIVTGLDPKFNYAVEASTPTVVDDDLPMDISAMSYRRADGSYSRRKVPLPE